MKKLLYLLLLIIPVAGFSQSIINLSNIAQPNTNASISSSVNTMTLSTTVGNASSAAGATTSGSNLVSPGSITSPGSWLELSFDQVSWSSSLSPLAVSGGHFTGQPVQFFARITSSATVNTYSGDIIIASGTATKHISVNGTVSAGTTAHFRSITIPTSSVKGGSDLSNYTLRVFGTLAYLKSVSNGGEVNNINGYDITFSTDNLGTSLLKWDMVSYDPTSGTFEADIMIPTLSASTSNVIYLRYGSQSITTFQGGQKGAAYDANTIAVYHMSTTLTAAGQTIPDATANGNDLTSVGTWVSGQQAAGKVGGALTNSFSGSGYATFTSQVLSTFTIEAWYNPTVGDQTTVVFGNTGTNENMNLFSDHLRIFTGVGDQCVDNGTLPINTWTHVAFTRNGATEFAYNNGTQTTTDANGATRTFNLLWKYQGYVTQNLGLDEVILSSVARSSGWVATDYANMNSPSTFYTIGPEN